MRRPLLAFALSLAVLASCGDDTASQSEPASTTQSIGTSESTDAPQEADASESTVTSPADTDAPDAPEVLQFTAPLLGGGTLDFTEYAGRTVALWFWAPT